MSNRRGVSVRSPLRLSLGGGGTDLPSYYRRFGGELVAGSINKYVSVSISPTSNESCVVSYSSFDADRSLSDNRQREEVDHPSKLQHPIIREAIVRSGLTGRFEVSVCSDLPGGTGLGSSGALTVALLGALARYRRYISDDKLEGSRDCPSGESVFEEFEKHQLAEEACRIEIDALEQPVGKQDQYASAIGGITRFAFSQDDSVRAFPLEISPQTVTKLEQNLLLFNTGARRQAHDALREQKERTEGMDEQMLQNLHATKELGKASMRALESGDLAEFARLMDSQWEHKRRRSGSVSSELIDHAYSVAKNCGCLGGKLIGGGGGGFMLLYAEQSNAIREAFAELGLLETAFKFDSLGVSEINGY